MNIRISKVLPFIAVGSLLVSLAAAACGDDGEKTDSGGTPSSTPGALDASYGKKDMENPRYGGTFRFMTRYGTPSLDVVATQTGGTGGTLNWVYEKLFTWEGHDNDLGADYVPVLAESYSASTDLKTYTIKLKKGIKWHDVAPVSGREFEARDVVYTFTEYMGPKSAQFGQYNQIQSVEASDKYTVVVKLKLPNAHFIEEIQGRQEYMIPYDLPAEARVGTAIGTGPFVIKSFQPGVTGSMKAVRNPNYWRKDAKGRQLPYLDEYEVYSNPEIAPKVVGMRTGQFHTVDSLTQNDVDSLKGSNIQVLYSLASGYSTYSIAFKTEKAPWNDQRVRCAVSKAIDKEKLSELRNGVKGELAGPIAWPLIEPNRPLTEADLGPCYKFDPEGAKKLLLEAGFGPSNPLKAKRTFGHEGEATTSENAVMQQMLAAVGVQMEIDRIDYTTYSTGIYLRQFDDWGAGFGSCGDINVTGCVDMKWATNARRNFGGMKIPAMDAALAELKVTSDPEKSRALLRKLWDQFVNDVPEVMPRAIRTPIVYSGNVRNVYVRVGIGGGLTVNTDSGRFLWFADGPRTTASAAEEQGGSDRNPATVQLQAVAERKARVVRS